MVGRTTGGRTELQQSRGAPTTLEEEGGACKQQRCQFNRRSDNTTTIFLVDKKRVGAGLGHPPRAISASGFCYFCRARGAWRLLGSHHHHHPRGRRSCCPAADPRLFWLPLMLPLLRCCDVTRVCQPAARCVLLPPAAAAAAATPRPATVLSSREAVPRALGTPPEASASPPQLCNRRQEDKNMTLYRRTDLLKRSVKLERALCGADRLRDVFCITAKRAVTSRPSPLPLPESWACG